jgi:hypothetical protein
MICEDGKCDYDTFKTEQKLMPTELPAAWEGLLTFDEYKKLCANWGLPDTERMAIFQSTSRPDAEHDVIFMPVAINPADPEWVLALIILDKNPPWTRVNYNETTAQQVRTWDLVRHDEWEPAWDNIDDELDQARQFFYQD